MGLRGIGGNFIVISTTLLQSAMPFKPSNPAVVMPNGIWSPWAPAAVIHVGAEAEVISGSWIGRPAILKKRVSRGYRHPKLDRTLSRQRIYAEGRILSRLNERGILSPKLLSMDQEEGWIIMSEVKGPTLLSTLEGGAKGDIEVELGKSLRSIHSQGISHGDLTTLNAIVSLDGIVLIDYGLGRLVAELEHLGLDLHSLHECLTAHHSDRPEAMNKVIQGYLLDPDSDGFDGRAVVDRFESIRSRVRYHA